jgi:hypothetical protein
MSGGGPWARSVTPNQVIDGQFKIVSHFTHDHFGSWFARAAVDNIAKRLTSQGKIDFTLKAL